MEEDILTREEYMAFAEQVNESFFAEPLEALGTLRDHLSLEDNPVIAVDNAVTAITYDKFYDKLKDLRRPHRAVVIEGRWQEDAATWLRAQLTEGLISLYNAYLADDEPIELDDPALVEETTWPRLMGHTPDLPERLSFLAGTLDKMGHFAQADILDKIMKNMIKSAANYEMPPEIVMLVRELESNVGVPIQVDWKWDDEFYLRFPGYDFIWRVELVASDRDSNEEQAGKQWSGFAADLRINLEPQNWPYVHEGQLEEYTEMWREFISASGEYGRQLQPFYTMEEVASAIPIMWEATQGLVDVHEAHKKQAQELEQKLPDS